MLRVYTATYHGLFIHPGADTTSQIRIVFRIIPEIIYWL